MGCQPKTTQCILSDSEDEIRSDIGDGSTNQENNAVLKEKNEISFYSSLLVTKPMYTVARLRHLRTRDGHLDVFVVLQQDILVLKM